MLPAQWQQEFPPLLWGEWIPAEPLLHQQCQARHAATHVRMARRQPGSHAAGDRGHARTAAMIRRRLVSPTSAPTRTQVPFGSVI